MEKNQISTHDLMIEKYTRSQLFYDIEHAKIAPEGFDILLELSRYDGDAYKYNPTICQTARVDLFNISRLMRKDLADYYRNLADIVYQYESLLNDKSSQFSQYDEKFFKAFNIKKDIELYLSGSDCNAVYRLSKMYDGKIMPIEGNALIFLKLAADNGQVNAQYEVALKLFDDYINVYNHQQRINLNKEPIKYYKAAADQGHSDAQNKLGKIYHGVESIKWHTMAAEQGHIQSQYELGGIYGYRDSEHRNYDVSNKWYHLAANNNDHTYDQMSKRHARNKLGHAWRDRRDISEFVDKEFAEKCYDENFREGIL